MSMTIYEIDERMAELVDPETGELLDYEAFAALQMEREAKIENMALWYKDLTAEAKAIREEEKALAERRKSAEAKAERLKGYLDTALAGESYKSAKVAISYRKSKAVDIAEGCESTVIEELETCGRGDCIYYTAPRINKVALARLLKEGGVIPGAELVERNNIQVR